MGEYEEMQSHPLGRFRNLSGERLRTARKVFLQDTAFEFVGAGVILAASYFHSDTLLLGAWGLVLVVAAAWFGRRLERHETYWQLLSSENKTLNQKSGDNLKDLHEFAKSLESSKK